MFDMSLQVVNNIIDRESLPRVRYGVVLFDEDAYVVVNLDEIPNKSKLMGFVSQLTRPKIGRNYEKGILKASEMFIEQGKPNAERTVMLLTDSRSNASPKEMENIKNQLLRARTRLIVVDIDGVGGNLMNVTPNDEDIVRVTSKDNPDQISEDVTNVFVKGKFFSSLSMNYVLTPSSPLTFPIILVVSSF